MNKILFTMIKKYHIIIQKLMIINSGEKNKWLFK